MKKIQKFVWMIVLLLGMSRQVHACEMDEHNRKLLTGVYTVVVSAEEKRQAEKPLLMVLHDRMFGNSADVLTADMIKKAAIDYLKESLSANHIQIVESSVPPPLKFPNNVEQRNVLFVHFQYKKSYTKILNKGYVNSMFMQILLRRNDFIPNPNSKVSTPNRLSGFRDIGLYVEPVSDLPQRAEKAVHDGLFDLTRDINCALDTAQGK